jgi:hypothetical protein
VHERATGFRRANALTIAGWAARDIDGAHDIEPTI